MAGYWTRLQFLLKVLIDLDSVSVHKKGKKNKNKNKQTNKQKTLADVQLSVTSPLVNNAYIYFMFPCLSVCKDLIR